ncbi:MAG: sigma-70 family RNA polymerase sigma factor [Acidimicrobiales bacterium]|nr:sigma-70 family RNA polymerase sigma factor [Acidimicrobiales bacterium]
MTDSTPTSTPTQPDDAALVATIRDGDPAAWGPVFDRHRDPVWRLAHGIVRSRADAEDVVQATFLKAVESLDQLRDPSALRPWLLSIARRRALDTVRRGREVAHDPGDGDWVDAGSSGAPDLVEGIRQDELSRLVTAAFDGLEPRDRAALELAERQELSGEELAEALDVTRDNAYQLLHAARGRFEASVASLVVARQGRADCEDLDLLLDGWNGELTPLLRKRVARHLKSCSTCAETKRLRVSPAALLATLPIVAMSTLAVDQSRAAAMDAAMSPPTGTAPAPAATGGVSLGAKVAAVLAVLAIGIGTALVLAAEDTEPPAAAAREVLPDPTVDAVPVTAPTTTTTIAAAPTTTNAPADFCTVADELIEVAAGGPETASPEGVVAYVELVDEHLQRLLLAAGDEASPEMEKYAAAYGQLVGLSADEVAAAGDDDELRALRDAFEDQLSAKCP